MGDFESPADVADDMQGEAGVGWSYAGRNLHYGVREYAMGAIMNGLATRKQLENEGIYAQVVSTRTD